jgi:hypothetical protein
LDLELDYGFEISKMYWYSTNEDFNAISKIVGSKRNFTTKLENSCCVDYEYNQYIDDAEPFTYCIKNTFNEKELNDIQKDPHWITVTFPDIIFHPSTDVENLNYSDNNPVFSYIYPLIKKMRLFKEGNICMPFLYFYACSEKSSMLISGLEYGSYVVPEQYTLNPLEISEFKNNIQNIEIPFTYDFLQLAFENFELSYEMQNKNLQFLTLMNGMEALFNIGGTEISYKLRRNVAVLLGEDQEDSKVIENRMKKLYQIRSNIVHNGKAKIEETELSDLRKYLRQSIIRFLELNQDKDFIFDLLSRRGFGESPINNIDPSLNPYFR